MSLASIFAATALTVLLVIVPSASASAQTFRPYWVQTHSPTELWSGADAKATSFGPIRTWSYLEVLTPQQGPRLYVKNPLSEGTAWVDANMAGPSGSPPEAYLKTGIIVTRTLNLPARAVGRARVRSEAEVREDNLVGNLSHNEGVRVIEEVAGLDGDTWFRIAENQFVHADGLRVPREPATRRAGRWIDADLSEPVMITMYEDNNVVDTALALKGTWDWETPRGTFTILRRVANETMSSDTIGIPRNSPGGYHLTNVLYTQYFTNDGSSFHFNYWSGNFGYRGSHGCLGLNFDDSLFLWHWADVGTVVEIRE
ncbi:MAG: L,D-transpeptidase [Chloroflexota bacterium]